MAEVESSENIIEIFMIRWALIIIAICFWDSL